MKFLLVIFVFALFVFKGCAVKGTVIEKNLVERANFSLSDFCDTVTQKKSIYISGIVAEITYDDKLYESKMSLYYLPDSALFLSVVNSGFEIFRSGIFKDSTLIINRLEKSVIIIYNDNSIPVTFEDIQLLFDNTKICSQKSIVNESLNQILIDKSIKDVKKIVTIQISDLKHKGFEFFNKKTGKYFVGERLKKDQLHVYGNFLIGNFELVANGGEVNFNVEKEIKLNINRSKYDVYYF